MQRIGRVDRRMDPDLEKEIVKNNPNLKDKRGKARFWNFLPPEELNNILSLYERVTHKTLRISKVFLIPDELPLILAHPLYICWSAGNSR